MNKKWFFALLTSVFFLCIIGIYQVFQFNDGKLHIIFCNVGQGDAVFIRTPQKVDILIDGGPDDSVLRCLSDHMPFWDRKIDLVFATHPDADHITGLIDVVQRYQIGAYATSIQVKETAVAEKLKRTLEDRGLKVKEIREGDRFRIGSENRRIGKSEKSENSEKSESVVLETLWPQEEFVREMPTDDTNEYSLVQKLTYGKTQVILTGDVTFDILNQILEKESNPSTHSVRSGNNSGLVEGSPSISSGSKSDSVQGSNSVDILKAPHHGSYTGINEDTFLYSKPQIVIISTGKNNRYGHPHESVLKELKSRKIPYLRTDEMGSIEFVSDGERVRIMNDE